MTDQGRIIISVEGGLVTSVTNIPPGMTVEVRDYDVDGADPEELTDTPDGPAYVTTITEDTDWIGGVKA